MRTFGFSTGAIAKDDVRQAMLILRDTPSSAVEISALRLHELTDAVKYVLSTLSERFTYLSFHAPSRFDSSEEDSVLLQLHAVAERGWPIVVHPDMIHTPSKWQHFGSLLLIENMDQRKQFGRTADELDSVFAILPKASLCFDFAHARQIDPTMTEAFRIIRRHGGRMKQIHLSDVDNDSKHHPLNVSAVKAFFRIAPLIKRPVAIILEATVSGKSQLAEQLHMAQYLFAAADAQRFLAAAAKNPGKHETWFSDKQSPIGEVARLKQTTEQLHSTSLQSFEEVFLAHVDDTGRNWKLVAADQ